MGNEQVFCLLKGRKKKKKEKEKTSPAGVRQTPPSLASAALAWPSTWPGLRMIAPYLTTKHFAKRNNTHVSVVTIATERELTGSDSHGV